MSARLRSAFNAAAALAACTLPIAAGCSSSSSGPCGKLGPGQAIASGATITSCDGRFQLTMQKDGNLVLYMGAGNPLWATGTNGTDGFQAVMQTDGNFVEYDSGGTASSDVLWSSGTSGKPGAYLVVQNDGNAVIYLGDQKPANALWASNTVVGSGGGGSSGGDCTASGGTCYGDYDCCSGSCSGVTMTSAGSCD